MAKATCHCGPILEESAYICCTLKTAWPHIPYSQRVHFIQERARLV
jgi:hypothetical protein